MNWKSMTALSPLTAAALALAATTLVAARADAADIKLRVADSFPAGHYIVEYGTKPWMEMIKTRTGGKVEFEYYPAEQLGKAKDLLSLTQSGVADIGYVAPSFVTDKLPLSAVAELPESFTTACQGTRAFWALAKEGGILDKREFEPAGVKALWVLVLSPYQLYMAKDNIDTLDVVKNKKIRTSGAAKILAVKKLGAVPVTIPTPEVGEALRRGTVDGMLFPHSSIIPYDLAKDVKYATVGENIGSFLVTYMISRTKWKALPEDVKKAFTEAGEFAVENTCTNTDNDEARDIERLKKDGVTFVTLPAADKKKLAEEMAGVSSDWADGLDKRGKPGSEVLKAFQAAIKK